MRPLLALVILLLACGATVPWWSAAARATPGAPRLAMSSVVTLDPTQASNLDEFRLLDALFEPLLRIDTSTQQVRPALAERWECSQDGLAWTFHLASRRWSDGSAVTAAQLVTGLQRHRAGSASQLPAAITSITASDEHTLVIVSRQALPVLPQILTSPVFIPWHPRLDEIGIWVDPTRLPTCGPLRCRGWMPRHHYDLEPAPFYDGPWRAVGPLRLQVVEDPGAAVRLYLDGRLDAVLRLNADTVGDLVRAGRSDVRRGPSWGTEFIRLRSAAHNGHAALDPRLRLALARSIDREAIVRELLHGNGEVATTLVPPAAALGYLPPSALLRYDLVEARALLHDLAEVPALELLMPSNQPERVRVAEWLCDRWHRDLGLTVHLVSVPSGLATSRAKALDYDLVRGSLVGDYLDPAYFLGCFRAGSGMNRTGWKDAEFEALLDKAEASQTNRLAILVKAEARLLSQAPIIPLHHYACSFLVRPTLTGVQPNLLEQVHLSDVGWAR